MIWCVCPGITIEISVPWYGTAIPWHGTAIPKFGTHIPCHGTEIFLRQRYNFYSTTARFLQYILTFLSEFNVSLQTCRHLHLVDCRYGIILTVDIKVENPLVEDYGAFGTHRWQSSLCTLWWDRQRDEMWTGEIDRLTYCEFAKIAFQKRIFNKNVGV